MNGTIVLNAPVTITGEFTIIPAETKLRDAFYYTLLRTGRYIGEETMLADSIAGYAELPIILDHMTDEQRREFKLQANSTTKEFLRKNKLHRVRIANMALSLILSENIISHDDTATIAELEKIYRKVETEKSAYCAWHKSDRLVFVNDVVIPFITKVCTEFIAR